MDREGKMNRNGVITMLKIVSYNQCLYNYKCDPLNNGNEDPIICPLCDYMKQFNKTVQPPRSIDTRPYIITVLDLTFKMFSIYKIYNILKGEYRHG